MLCDLCNRPNYSPTVCCSKTKPRNQPPDPSGSSHGEAEGAVFAALCTATSLDQDRVTNIISIDHLLYDHLNDCWVRKASKPQPFITPTTTVNPADYTALGYKPITVQPKTMRPSAMADTSCQICLASMIHLLGLRDTDLIPVTMCMHAANNNGITILGAAIMRFSGTSPSGQTLET